MVKNPKEVTILLIEDDDVDAQSIIRAINKLKILNPIVRAYDGINALSHLRGNGEYPAITKPYIILLDINMPRMNGLEFLEVIRDDKQLQDSIIFVLTTSKSEEDRMTAFHKNVAGYIVKSEVENGFLEVLKMIQNYWRIVELPV